MNTERARPSNVIPRNDEPESIPAEETDAPELREHPGGDPDSADSAFEQISAGQKEEAADGEAYSGWGDFDSAGSTSPRSEAEAADLPPGWRLPGEEDQEEPVVAAETEEAAARPNWMMCFVCAVAGLTSLYEAFLIGSSARFARGIITTPDFGGYAVLGAGLLLFAVESLWWNRGRRRGRLLRYGGSHLLLILLAALLTLAGLTLLFLSRDPGRRI